MIDITEERRECDRRMARNSTYGSCGCGFDHVPGCRTRVTERFISWGIIIVGVMGSWWILTG